MTRTALRKLLHLSPREWRDLIEAQVALLIAQAIVATRPTGQLVDNEQDAVAALDDAVDPRAEALARAVGRAADYGIFRPLCLVRALALHRVLERHGIRGSRVRIGVRMLGGRFAAHAWVEHGARILGDVEAHVSSFTELTDVRLVDTR